VSGEAGGSLRIDLLLLMRRIGVMAHADAHITLHTAIRGGTTCIQQGNSSTRHCSVVADAQQGRYSSRQYAQHIAHCHHRRHLGCAARQRLDCSLTCCCSD
jgi:hypothetical protein